MSTYPGTFEVSFWGSAAGNLPNVTLPFIPAIGQEISPRGRKRQPGQRDPKGYGFVHAVEVALEFDENDELTGVRYEVQLENGPPTPEFTVSVA